MDCVQRLGDSVRVGIMARHEVLLSFYDFLGGLILSSKKVYYYVKQCYMPKLGYIIGCRLESAVRVRHPCTLA